MISPLALRIIRSYRQGGPLFVPTVRGLLERHHSLGMDLRGTHPWIFDAEAVSHFRQTGVLDTMSSLDLGPRNRVLSLGEGNGAASRLMAKLFGCRVTGIDVNPAQIDAARRLSGPHGVSRRVDYLRQDVNDLDLGRRRFDRLWANETLCHWRNHRQTLEHALKHLKPGALLGFNEWLRGDRGGLEKAEGRIPGFLTLYAPGIWFQTSLPDLSDLLRSLGCRILRRQDATDEIDLRLRRWKQRLLLERPGPRRRQGLFYFEVMLKTHYRYLRYGRLVAQVHGKAR